MKPGCFGSTLGYNVSSEVCQACEYRVPCSQVSMTLEAEVARKVRAFRHLDADKGEEMARKLEHFFKCRRLTKNEQAMTQMSARAKRDYEYCVDKGIDFSLISQGKNPFSDDDNLVYLKHAVDRIIDYRAVRPKDIREYLEEQEIGSARSMASYALKILTALEILTKEGTLYCLK